MKDAKVFLSSVFRRALTRISPTLNTKVCYYAKFHKRLDLKNPKTLNEKISWLKLKNYSNNPLVKQCADKYKVREYLEDCGLSQLLNIVYGVYTNVDDIEWDKLPESFALKLNVGCDRNIIVPDKSKLDIEKTKEIMRGWLKDNTYWVDYSELQYKGVTPCILIEKYLGDKETGALPVDYKFYCFNASPEFVMFCVGRENEGHPKFYFFDKNWKLARINRDSKAAPEGFSLEKPKCFEQLLEAATILAKPFPFVRADFYIVDEKPIFGELTFTPTAGMDTNRLPETDVMMGNMLKLPKVNI